VFWILEIRNTAAKKYSRFIYIYLFLYWYLEFITSPSESRLWIHFGNATCNRLSWYVNKLPAFITMLPASQRHMMNVAAGLKKLENAWSMAHNGNFIIAIKIISTVKLLMLHVQKTLKIRILLQPHLHNKQFLTSCAFYITLCTDISLMLQVCGRKNIFPNHKHFYVLARFPFCNTLKATRIPISWLLSKRMVVQ
jgi:hypothetical protein